MIFRSALAFALVAGAVPAIGRTPEASLERTIGNRHAEPPVDCIRPDLNVRPEIFDQTAIVYRDARRTYVNRLNGRCPQLREGRRIIVTGAGGRLCRNDPVRVVEATGAGFGFCTLGPFIPYAR